MSVPNQKSLTIVKPNITPPFLQIGETNWQEAFKVLSPSAFGIYLYLAQNAAGYSFEYSPAAIEKAGLMSRGTATKARQELERLGYIEDGRFYVESPQRRNRREQLNTEITNMTGS